MAEIEVYNPSGSVESGESCRYAPRLDDLNGKTICEVSNGRWEYDQTFPLIRELLKKRFPDIKFVPYTDLPVQVHNIDVENIGDIVAAKGCDAVIGGNSG